MNDLNVRNDLLSMINGQYKVFKINNSYLKKKTIQVVFNFIQENYSARFYKIQQQRYLVFKRMDVDQDLLDLLHDLSITPITEEELKNEIIMTHNEDSVQ